MTDVAECLALPKLFESKNYLFTADSTAAMRNYQVSQCVDCYDFYKVLMSSFALFEKLPVCKGSMQPFELSIRAAVCRCRNLDSMQ